MKLENFTYWNQTRLFETRQELFLRWSPSSMEEEYTPAVQAISDLTDKTLRRVLDLEDMYACIGTYEF